MNNLADELGSSLKREWLEGISVHESTSGDYVIKLPFTDGCGYPIEIMVRGEGAKITLDDGGIIAGNLFTLGQQAVDSPAFKLLNNLSRAHDFKIDFNKGVVAFGALDSHVIERIMDLLKVIITLTTATPFIRVSPNRPIIGGQRLRTKIKKAYIEQQILDIVEENFKLTGDSVESWPIDFHWQVQRDMGAAKDVYIVALDLEVAESLQKAERVAGLALDTRSTIGDNFLRVIIDKSYSDNRPVNERLGTSDAATAARFLEQHKGTLKYSLYNFGDESQRDLFVRQSVTELMGDMGREWRSLWSQRKTRTLPFSRGGAQ